MVTLRSSRQPEFILTQKCLGHLLMVLMSSPRQLDTHQKALAINLDQTIFGSIAEIGAGQEVARWFLRVGAASGTVAKTVSAYDKEVSDDLYGAGSRYVSIERLEAMLDREWHQLLTQLEKSRGPSTRFFSFADTVSARNFSGTNECHGWMGIRFQDEPGGEANDVLLHINLRDLSNLLQQEVLGVVGVNLIYAVFYQRTSPEDLSKVLLDQAGLERIEIDFIDVRGAVFQGWNRQDQLLGLVRENLAEAVVFPSGNHRGPPTEILRKRPIVLAPLGWESLVRDHEEMLSAAVRELKTQSGNAATKPLGLFAIPMSPPSVPSPLHPSLDLSNHIDALVRRGSGVLLFGYSELYRMTSFINRYTQAPVRFVVGVSSVIQLFSLPPSSLEGRLLEGLSRLFAQNVCVYVYPMTRVALEESLPSALAAGWKWKSKQGLISADQLQAPPPLGHLLAYLLASKFVVPLRLAS
jgi:hypothetical protein